MEVVMEKLNEKEPWVAKNASLLANTYQPLRRSLHYCLRMSYPLNLKLEEAGKYQIQPDSLVHCWKASNMAWACLE